MLSSALNPQEALKQLPTDNGAIDLSKLIQLQGGGTHDIYRLNSHSPFLIKVVKRSVGNEQPVLEAKLADLSDKYAKLYAAFGTERCLQEVRSIQRIKPKDSPTAQDAIVSLVTFDTCFQSKNKFGFNTEAVETKEYKLKIKPAQYRAMNQFLLGKDKSSLTFDKDEFLFFHESFRPIFAKLEQEPGLRTVMQEFLAKFKRYYQETDQLLDFTGLDNVVFYQDANDQWQYKVGSVIKTETGKRAVRLIAQIDTHPAVVKGSFEDWTHIYFVPSWCRVLNATAALLGMDRIIDNITLSQKDSENLAKMYEMLPLSERAVNCAEGNDFFNAQLFFTQYQSIEKEHDTWSRHMLGKLYWNYVKQDAKRQPPLNTALFISLLIDPKNTFPEATWDEVRCAILGLQAQLETEGLADIELKHKIDAMLARIGGVPTPKAVTPLRDLHRSQAAAILVNVDNNNLQNNEILVPKFHA